MRTDTYLLQVAAAVAGYSGGAPVHVVICGRREPYQILGVFPTGDQAAAAMSQPGHAAPCTVEGPFTAGPTYGTAGASYGTGCKKAPDSSCLDDTAAVFIAPMDQVS
ncbi:MAG: hypothetical protein ACREME_10200, partial [Gemmatimonadales bacterium]